MKALVIGGTGPTGHLVVQGLVERGYEVTLLHSGRHEIPETPEHVEHVHTDAYSKQDFAQSIQGRDFDLCYAGYGRLRAIAEVMQGRCERFVSIGGVPAYRGFMHPDLFTPPGLPVPTSEDAPLVRDPAHDEKGYRIVRTEEQVFDLHPRATHFRYPYVYGPYQMLPREWCIVRRILDGRPHIVVPDGGLTLHSFGYSGNLAHGVLLAVEQPEAAAGQIYNCCDEETLSLRQVIEVIAAGLDHEWEIVSLPWELATPARPLVAQPLPTHRVLDISKIRTQLGYRDAVPAREALVRTAKWLVANPPQPGGMEETTLTDPFDYAAEDELVAAWRETLARMPEVEFESQPGFTLSYSGPGGRPRTQESFE